MLLSLHLEGEPGVAASLPGCLPQCRGGMGALEKLHESGVGPIMCLNMCRAASRDGWAAPGVLGALGDAKLPQAPPDRQWWQILTVAHALRCVHALVAPDQPGPV